MADRQALTRSSAPTGSGRGGGRQDVRADPFVRPPAGGRRRTSTGRGTPPLLRWRDRLAELGAADAGRAQRSGRPVDFWTYTCVNWLRTPLRPSLGREVPRRRTDRIGVHTPEFGFERELDNVTARAKDFGVEYPIAIDSDYGVWRAFANHFWPAVYIADTEGRIRYHHFGEGEYAQSEMVIQQLLLDAGAAISIDLVAVEPRARGRCGLADAATPETYLGMGRAPASRPDRQRLDEPTPTRHPRGCDSTSGPDRGLDARRHAAVLNRPAAASRSSSTPETSIS